LSNAGYFKQRDHPDSIPAISTAPVPVPSLRGSIHGAVQPEKHREFQAPCDSLCAIDEHFSDFREAASLDRLVEMPEPYVEILLAHLLQLEVRWYGAAAIGAVLQDNRTPEVGHLLEMGFPV